MTTFENTNVQKGNNKFLDKNCDSVSQTQLDMSTENSSVAEAVEDAYNYKLIKVIGKGTYSTGYLCSSSDLYTCKKWSRSVTRFIEIVLTIRGITTGAKEEQRR
jgi:hypothetical protein